MIKYLNELFFFLKKIDSIDFDIPLKQRLKQEADGHGSFLRPCFTDSSLNLWLILRHSLQIFGMLKAL